MKLSEIDKAINRAVLKRKYPRIEITDYNPNEVHMLADMAKVGTSTLHSICDTLGANDIYVTWCPAMHVKGVVVVATY